MTHKHRIKALECAYAQKIDPPRLEVTRPGDGWVYVYWGGQLVKTIAENLYDAI